MFLETFVTIVGLRNCRWPGRAQTVKKAGVTYYLDGAHTPRSLQVGSFTCVRL